MATVSICSILLVLEIWGTITGRLSATSTSMVTFSKSKGGELAHFSCDQCGKACVGRASHYRRKRKHFCAQSCYSEWRRNAPPSEQPSWKGGVSATEAHRRWKRKNPERMAFLKARRYARERGATGSHSIRQWNDMKRLSGGKCKHCGEVRPLTKDHIMPLSKGGSDDISNIQPLCRNCNSKKWATMPIYQNPELLQQ